jgi:hypothetical protein
MGRGSISRASTSPFVQRAASGSLRNVVSATGEDDIAHILLPLRADRRPSALASMKRDDSHPGFSGDGRLDHSRRTGHERSSPLGRPSGDPQKRLGAVLKVPTGGEISRSERLTRDFGRMARPATTVDAQESRAALPRRERFGQLFKLTPAWAATRPAA